MSVRQSKKVIKNVSREQCEEAFAKYNNALSSLRIIEGEMNSKITAVKEKYEPKVNGINEEKEEAYEVLEAFAKEKPELFEGKKSIEFTHGIMGFRTGMPKLSPRRGFKWPAVLEMVKDKLADYIRIKEDVNKEKLLADRSQLDLKSVGLEVTQDEDFYVTPKLEELVS